MSLSTCEKCGGNIPLGPDATNRCEDCGEPVFSIQHRDATQACEACALIEARIAALRAERDAKDATITALRELARVLGDALEDSAPYECRLGFECHFCTALARYEAAKKEGIL
jgi:hypothetical protein